MTGVERIAEAFERARANGRRAALMPYMMGCFPDRARSVEIARAYVANGADLIELGVPFSDPLADGPVIHAAGTAALRAGANVHDALAIAREIEVPVVVMCYANQIFARGIERFADVLEEVGASGLIVPDLPLEEAPSIAEVCEKRRLALVPLVAPTTPEDRLARIGAGARGFIYTVSLVGTTGERASLDGGLAKVVARTRAHTSVPVAVGFGIGTPAQAADAVRAGADGVIIGSRLVRAAADGEDVGTLVSEFGAALQLTETE